MTEDELRGIEAWALGREGGQPVINLVAEVRRLKGLVMDAEWNGAAQWGYVACPWCESDRMPFANDRRVHRPDCPAFTPDGAVR